VARGFLSARVALNPFEALGRLLTRALIRFLTKPTKQYQIKFPVDMARLKRHICKGDVVLVEGNERISEIIKYLTQSSWSHAALYVGDEPLRRDIDRGRKLVELYGAEAQHMLLEALPEDGVVLAPLIKYQSFNIRVCRPYNLARRDLERLLERALSEVGHQYDLKNILDLARYFFPFTVLPRRWQREAFNFGSGEPTRVMCSSMIAALFSAIKFPVIPRVEAVNAPRDGRRSLGNSLRRFLGRAPAHDSWLFRPTPPALVSPRDFDLSPYFEVVKFNIIEEMKFDYRRIAWADSPEVEAKAKTNGSA
jgi:hypothetical protein